MKCTFTEGCICGGSMVDDKNFTLLPIERQKEVIKILIGRNDDPGFLQSVFDDLVMNLGNYESIGHCDECGDDIDEWTYEF